MSTTLAPALPDAPEFSVTTPPAADLVELLTTAPLPALLDAANARIIDSEIDDEWFFGAAIQRKDGRIFLTMPTGRPEWERNTVARDLLSRMLRVPLPGQRKKRLAAA
jgi:hypothetical protein